MKNPKKWLLLVPVACGILVFFLMVRGKQPPEQSGAGEREKTVRVIPAVSMTVTPRVIGYGYVEPSQTWDAISEVSGKIIEIRPELKKGGFVKKGAILLRLDPSTYGLAESRGQADVMNVDAQLKELEQSRKNNERLLAVEKRSLELSGQELERKRELFKQGFISASDLESEEKAFLAQQTSVNNLINALDLIPSQRKAILAQKESGEFTLTERRLDVEKTIIRAPFDCRLSEVNVDLNQFAGVGTVLLKADSIAAVEIPVQLSPDAFVNLLPPGPKLRLGDDISMDKIRRAIGISAIVRLPLFSQEAVWPAVFARTSESIDPITGAMTVYVSVERPYEKVIPSKRPPLLPNFYCEVELKGQARKNRFAIPLNALHDGYVYVVGPDQRLLFQKVHPDFVQGDVVIIKEGLTEDSLVVVTDLVPAIEGMRLNPIVDESLSQKIATGAV